MKGVKNKGADIDLGLAVMREMILQGRLDQPVDIYTMGEACGVTWQAISNIEQRALRKLRRALYRDKDLAREFLDHIRL